MSKLLHAYFCLLHGLWVLKNPRSLCFRLSSILIQSSDWRIKKEQVWGNLLLDAIGSWDKLPIPGLSVFCEIWELAQIVVWLPVTELSLVPNYFWILVSNTSYANPKERHRQSRVSWASSLNSRSQPKWFLTVWPGECLWRGKAFVFSCIQHGRAAGREPFQWCVFWCCPQLLYLLSSNNMSCGLWGGAPWHVDLLMSVVRHSGGKQQVA